MDQLYQWYYETRKKIEKAENSPEKDHYEIQQMIADWENTIEVIDGSGKGYPNRYERDIKIQESFTAEQRDFICSQIEHWYLMMKPLLEGTHNLGHKKEVLKGMICGE